LNADGTGGRYLTDLTAGGKASWAFGPAWSPDGHTILYVGIVRGG
jgi:Tol biopolymer transport system component